MDNFPIDNILSRAKQLKPELDRQEAEQEAERLASAQREAERKVHDEKVRVSNERASDFVRLMEEYEIPKIEFYARKIPQVDSSKQVEVESLGAGWIIEPTKTTECKDDGYKLHDYKDGIFLIAKSKIAYELTNIDKYRGPGSGWGLRENETVVPVYIHHLQGIDAPFAYDEGLNLLATAAILHGVV